MCIVKTLNMDSCSKFWGNLEGIWGNPGEIPHIGWKIPRVYRVKNTYTFIISDPEVVFLFRFKCQDPKIMFSNVCPFLIKII